MKRKLIISVVALLSISSLFLGSVANFGAVSVLDSSGNQLETGADDTADETGTAGENDTEDANTTDENDTEDEANTTDELESASALGEDESNDVDDNDEDDDDDDEDDDDDDDEMDPAELTTHKINEAEEKIVAAEEKIYEKKRSRKRHFTSSNITR